MTRSLSIRQPWAWAIVTPGIGKDIENRDWPTRYRGRVLIHAGVSWYSGKRDAQEDLDCWCDEANQARVLADDLPRGGIVGEAVVSPNEINDSEETTGAKTGLKRRGFRMPETQKAPPPQRDGGDRRETKDARKRQTVSMDELRSNRALVSYREVHGEEGGATVWCVVLADGFLLDCGSGSLAELRAKILARTINAGSPEQFTREGMLASDPAPF